MWSRRIERRRVGPDWLSMMSGVHCPRSQDVHMDGQRFQMG
jgi:hypothetical protein